MVTFVCDVCQTTLKKAKVLTHNCRSDSFSCVDCNKNFTFDETKKHSECISEAEKHQGSLFKGKRKGSEPEKKAEEVKKVKVEKEEKPKSKINMDDFTAKIVKILAEKPQTLRVLKKRLVKEDNATDDDILTAIFGVARKITLSANKDDDDD